MVSPILFPDWSDKLLLIAEDMDANYAVLAALLKRTNIRLMWAHNGQEAVDLVTQYPEIDIVLMDISMPDFSGIEALRQIKQQIPDKIVIAQTAHDLSEEIITKEFDDFLQKPISRKELIAVLDKYLS